MNKSNNFFLSWLTSRSLKFWLNTATFILIVVILIAARKDIASAFKDIGRADWLVLSLLLPLQFLSYFAGTEVFLTYLRDRGQLKNVNVLEATSMSLELNFMNHVFPSGGVSGIGYMSWRLGKFGVSAGQSTLAQIMKYVVQMAVFMAMMILALIWAMLTDQMANWIAVATTIAVVSFVFILFFGAYIIGSEKRMRSFSRFFADKVNLLVFFLSFKRKKEVLSPETTEKFFLDFHADYVALMSDKRILLKPIFWSFVFLICDVSLFMITFASLGTFVNPAILFIAFGAAALSGTFMVTPGGTGAYETIMIGILTASGVPATEAFAGVILARVILILLTLVSGSFVYQRALHKYGSFRTEEKS